MLAFVISGFSQLLNIGPYEELGDKKRSKIGMKVLEKRAVAIVHEFMSLTV